MRFCVLGSGSKGNAVLVDAGGTHVLIDCGYSAKETRRRMSDVGRELTQLNALLITHGHGDHVKGARALASGMNLLTYATDDTVAFCARRAGLVNHARIEPNEPFTIGNLSVTPFATPHDAKGSVGFVLDDGNVRLGYCTDLGAPEQNVIDALRETDAMYLEFNHDLEMLMHGPYPAHLKRRVASRYGHLSNDDGARILRAAKGPRLRRVLLAHLSEVNNTPRLALAAAAKAVGHDDIAIQVAPQHAPSVWFDVGDAASENRVKPSRGSGFLERSAPRLASSPAPSDENSTGDGAPIFSERDELANARSQGSPVGDAPYGMHPAAAAAAEERANAVGGAPGRSTAARAAARARADRLFGGPPVSAAAAPGPRATLVEVVDAPLPPPSVSPGPRPRVTGAELALRLAKRAAAEKREKAEQEQLAAASNPTRAPAPAGEAGPASKKHRSPSTARSPSSKRQRTPSIAVTRQLSLFGGAGDDA